METPASAPRQVLAAWSAPREARGQPIERALKLRFPRWTPDHVANLLRQHRICVSGVAVALGFRLVGGERIEVLERPRQPRTFLPNRSVTIRFVHRDACLAVIEKPSGLPVSPGPGHGSRTLLNGLLAHFGSELAELGAKRAHGLVHRLDQGASGLMVVPRSPFAYDTLRRAFTERRIAKRYLALVAGDPSEDRYHIEAPVGGKTAISDIVVAERFGLCALLEVKILTGRNHQIRIHSAGIGHPVLGDSRYGPERPPSHPLSALHVQHIFLHAAELGFHHPATLQWMSFTAKLPRHHWRVLERLRRGDRPKPS